MCIRDRLGVVGDAAHPAVGHGGHEHADLILGGFSGRHGDHAEAQRQGQNDGQKRFHDGFLHFMICPPSRESHAKERAHGECSCYMPVRSEERRVGKEC